MVRKSGVLQVERARVIAYASAIRTVAATTARSELYKLIDATLSDREPSQITRKRGNAVLIAEGNWRAIQETLYLAGIPGVRESILKGMKEPLSKCSPEIDL